MNFVLLGTAHRLSPWGVFPGWGYECPVTGLSPLPQGVRSRRDRSRGVGRRPNPAI